MKYQKLVCIITYLQNRKFCNFNFNPLNIFEQKLNREFLRKIVFVNRMFIMDLPTNEAIFNSIRIDLHMFLFEFFVDDIQNFFFQGVEAQF